MVIRTVRAIVRLAALGLLTIGLLAAYGAVRWTSRARARTIIRLWHRSAGRIAGMRLCVRGAPLATPGALLVANHVSYLDILALGALVDASFVAKAGVARWPIVGYLARIADTIFVDRERAQARTQIGAIMHRLSHGRSVVLFPEGTSTRGRGVQPFKSTLFETARGRAVQPVSIVYARDIRGAELSIAERCVHPWVGADALVPHLWTLLQHPGVTADVVFHAPVAAAAFASRKALAEHCRDECARGLALARRRSPFNLAAPQPAAPGAFALLS